MRGLILVASFLTGFSSLILQPIWQRYLSYLVGADAKSQSLLVGIFLFGLSAGYLGWGRVAKRLTNKKLFLLSLYGGIELLIALWAISFGGLFQVISVWSHSANPSVANDILATLGLIFPPAFLMGGTVPLLTVCLPKSQREVAKIHSWIYGINSLGACLGVLFGGVFLIPQVGLIHSSYVAVFINLVAVTILIFCAAKLKQGNIEETHEFGFDNLKKADSGSVLAGYWYAFLSGVCSVGFEIILFRTLNFGMGTTNLVYPIVVSVFIFGLSIGSFLSSQRTFLSFSVFRSFLFSAIGFAIFICSSPFLTLWISIINKMLQASNHGYEISLIFTWLLLAAFTLPITVALGQLLPNLFSVFGSDKKDFPRICGNIYGFNTLGCLIGGIGIGYFAFLSFPMDQILKLLLMLAASGALLQLNLLKRFRPMVVLGVGVLSFVITFSPNKELRYVSLHEFPGELNLFEIPVHPAEKIFLKDDPLATIAVLKHPTRTAVVPPFAKDLFFYSVQINGKTDGGTYSDSLTTTMLGLLPYVFHPNKELKVAIVGLGTGVTAGLLTQLKDVSQIDVLEISSGLIEAVKLIEDHNFKVLNNKKVKIYQADAFRFFAQNKTKYDVIISEPSSMWSVGSDSLYTQEFYQLVERSLNKNGIFMNWVHLYNNNHEGFFNVMRGVFQVFQQVSGFVLSGGVDLGMIVTKEVTTLHADPERFFEYSVQPIFNYFSFFSVSDVFMNQMFSWDRNLFHQIDKGNPQKIHTLNHPFLGYLGAESRFKHEAFDPRRDPLLLTGISSAKNSTLWTLEKSRSFMDNFENENSQLVQSCKNPDKQLINPNCNFILFVKNLWQGYEKTKKTGAELSRIKSTLVELGALQQE